MAGFGFMILNDGGKNMGDPKFRQEAIDDLRYKFKLDFIEDQRLTKDYVLEVMRENNKQFTDFKGEKAHISLDFQM